MAGVPDGPVALDIGVQHPAEVGRVALELFQVAVRMVAGEGRRQHKGRVAEEVVPHVGLIGHLVLGTLENLADEGLVGGRARQLADGDLPEVDGRHMVPLPVARRGHEGEEDVLPRQRGGQGVGPHVVAHEDEVLGGVGQQGLPDRVQLRAAGDHKDHVVAVLRPELRHHRDPADGHPGGELVLDPQAVLPDLLPPGPPGQQRDILPGSEQIPCEVAAQHARAEYQNSHLEASRFEEWSFPFPAQGVSFG